MRIISVRMDYLPAMHFTAEQLAARSDLANVSCYAVGRDYHKLMRKRLQKMAQRIEAAVGEFG